MDKVKEQEGQAPQEQHVAQEGQAPAQVRPLLKCDDCGGKHTIEELLTERPVDAERAGEKGVTETGLLCPDCGYWQHTHFTNGRLRKLKRKLDAAVAQMNRSPNPHTQRVWGRAKHLHQKNFDLVQTRLRKRLGVKSPAAASAERKILERMRAMGAAKNGAADEEE